MKEDRINECYITNIVKDQHCDECIEIVTHITESKK